jgi:hypothetical protein
MDKIFIAENGENMLSYRMRTKRQKKRIQYEDFDKYLIQLSKKESGLYEKIASLGSEPLIPPIQRGWKRTFVLREDVARTTEAAFFAGILKKINTKAWSYRKDFKIKRRKRGRKIYVVSEQKLLSPFPEQFSRLDFNELEKKFFYKSWTLEGKQLVKRLVFKDPWRFVLRTTPNMIDHIKRVDAELESELQQLRDFLECNNYRRRLSKITGDRYRWRFHDFEKHDEVYLYKNKTLKYILDRVKEDSLTLPGLI